MALQRYVKGMPLKMDYATTADVKAHLGITTSNDDAVIATCVTAASSFIDGRTSSVFGNETGTTRIFDTDGGTTFDLPFPIRAVTTMKIRPFTGQAQIVVPSTDFFLENDTRPYGWPYDRISLTPYPTAIARLGWGYQSLEITGDFGWAAVPAEIKLATIAIAGGFYKTRGARGEDTGPDGNTISPGSAIPRSALRLIEPYVRIHVASSSVSRPY